MILFENRELEIWTNFTLESFVKDISMGCIYVTRCWFSYSWWF